MIDDVIQSTQYIKYIKRPILANLQCRPLKHGRLKHIYGYKKFYSHDGNSLFLVPTHLTLIHVKSDQLDTGVEQRKI